MPPKPAAKAPAAAPAGPALSPEQVEEKILLIQECTRLEEQRVSELAQFTALKEEKEQLNALWAAAKKSVDERRAELRAKRRAKDDLAEQHSVEIKVFKQRIKHLLFEHQADTTDTLTDGQAALKLGLEEHVGSERELKADRRDLKALLKEMETAHEEFVRTLKAEQDRAVTELRLEFERDTRELQAVYDDKMTRLREELNRGREEDIRSIERRKTKQIQALIASHEKAFNDIKLYYNEITHSNLDLIKSLKEEVEDLKKKEAGDEKVMYAIAQENKKMSEPMRKALDEVRRLREQREEYRKDIQALHETKAQILVSQDKLENMRWEHVILDQRFARLAGERDALYDRFSAALHDVKQKTGFRNMLLEQKVSAAAEEVERQSLTLSELLASANLDPRVLGAVEKKLTDVVVAKENAVKALQVQLAQVASTHDRAIDSFLRAMVEYGVRPEELGFIPARSHEVLGIALSQ